MLIGFLISEKECDEINYLLRKELDSILEDLEDKNVDKYIKEVRENRYKRVYGLFSRVANNDQKKKYSEQYNKLKKGK